MLMKMNMISSPTTSPRHIRIEHDKCNDMLIKNSISGQPTDLNILLV